MEVKPRATAAQRGYGSLWQKYRAGYLLSHPYCTRCGRLVNVVDHIKAHRGDQELFWDKSNQAALCATCHNSYKQRLEKLGRVIGCDVKGIPTDPGHPWRCVVVK